MIVVPETIQFKRTARTAVFPTLHLPTIFSCPTRLCFLTLSCAKVNREVCVIDREYNAHMIICLPLKFRKSKNFPEVETCTMYMYMYEYAGILLRTCKYIIPGVCMHQ